MRGRTVLVAVAVLVASPSCRRSPEERARALVAAADGEMMAGSVSAARRAIGRYDEALAVWRATRDPGAEAETHAKLHAALDTAGDTTRARKELELAVDGFHRAGDAAGVLLAAADLAAYEVPPANRAAAIVAIEALLPAIRAARLPGGEARTLNQLGLLYVYVERTNVAIPTLVAALPLARAAGDAPTEALLELHLGVAYYNVGDVDRSREHLQRLLPFARAHGLRVIEADALKHIGMVEFWAAVPRSAFKALPNLQRALAIYRELGLGGTFNGLQAWYTIGAVLTSMGDYPGALAELTGALAEARRAGIDDAEQSATQMLGLAYAEARMFPEARRAFEDAGRLADKLGNGHMSRYARISLARVALAERRWRDAEALIQEFLAMVAKQEAELADEQLRLSLSFAIRSGTVILLEALAGEGAWDAAFVASEKLRARHLLAAIAGTDPLRLPVVDVAGAQTLLDVDTTLVEYAFAETTVFAFVIDARTLAGVRIGSRAEVERPARRWYDLASSTSTRPEELAAAGRELSDRLLGPVLPLLHGKRLVVVPDRNLHYVPLAALPLPGGEPLLSRFEVTQVPSASVLAEQRRVRPRRPRQARAVVILADPIFDAGDPRLDRAAPPAPLLLASNATRAAGETGLDQLVRLPATALEAETIAALVPRSQSFVAVGAAATRELAMGPEVASARIIHFATHGLLNNVRSDQSGLVFSLLDGAGRPIDGFLSVADIEKLRLAADLVVLSACRTAIGKRFDGEGLIGVTRAFLRAGVPRVVSSLWQVDDAATAELMKRFYGGLLGEGLSPPAALRSAQLALAADPRFSSPRLWAGFAFYGDWK